MLPKDLTKFSPGRFFGEPWSQPPGTDELGHCPFRSPWRFPAHVESTQFRPSPGVIRGGPGDTSMQGPAAPGRFPFLFYREIL